MKTKYRLFYIEISKNQQKNGFTNKKLPLLLK